MPPSPPLGPVAPGAALDDGAPSRRAGTALAPTSGSPPPKDDPPAPDVEASTTSGMARPGTAALHGLAAKPDHLGGSAKVPRPKAAALRPQSAPRVIETLQSNVWTMPGGSKDEGSGGGGRTISVRSGGFQLLDG